MPTGGNARPGFDLARFDFSGLADLLKSATCNVRLAADSWKNNHPERRLVPAQEAVA